MVAVFVVALIVLKATVAKTVLPIFDGQFVRATFVGKTETCAAWAREKRSQPNRFGSDGNAGKRQVGRMLRFGAEQLRHCRTCPAGDEHLRFVGQVFRQPLDQFAHCAHGPPI